ncbi:uncharacterized protein LOC116293383 [Actinia tenebrosa]|uniref:Uncharacterized protein LOC116293383 n=1 Tax=Actinia tenebrosa TaxID=6105 RepID=A0A6P8HJV4_ACTTE|nr:uncharacterized protein LOC116293383 [Actinia tenebrosa]
MAENVPFDWRHEMDGDGWSIPEQSKSIEVLFRFANDHYKNKNYDEALQYYGLILKRAKEATDNQADSNAVYAFMKSLYMISRCQMEMGNYEDALNNAEIVCKMVVSNCPDKVHIPEQLMIELKERRDDIIGAFILALIFKQLHPSNPQYGKLLSNIQEKVEESFTKQSGVINNTFDILMKKGKKLYKNDEYSTAAAFFEKVIEVFCFLPDENLQKAYIWVAQCFLMMGDLDQAKSKVEKVLVRFSSNSKARKLHEDIVEKAKQAKAQEENASHLPDHSKGKQQDKKMSKIKDNKNEVKKMVADHKPGVSSGNVLPKQVTAKTQGPRQSSNQPSRSATKSTDSVNVASVNQSSRSAVKSTDSVRTGNRHNAMNNIDSTWEGLPKQATVNTKKPRQSSNQPSPSSTNATVNTKGPCQSSNTLSPSANRYSVLRSFSNDDSTVTQNNSAKSPVVKNGIATHDSARSKAENRNLEQSEPLPSDESNEGSFQTVKARKHCAKNKVTERKPFCLPEGVEVIWQSL